MLKWGLLLLLLASAAEVHMTSAVSSKCSHRPTSTVRTAPSAFYDYVIVGGGTGGAVVAGRLAEDPSIKVLLIEGAGDIEDDAWASEISTQLWDLPYCNPLEGKTCPAESLPLHISDTPLSAAWASHTDLGQQYYTTVQNYAGKKETQYARGQGLGGSSTISYMVSVRGTPPDFDDLWTKKEGLVGWTYQDVLPYYKKLETVSTGGGGAGGEGVPADAYHGTDGPACTSKATQLWHFPLWPVIEQAGADLGIPVTKDFSNASSYYGIGQQTLAVCPDGRRSSTRAWITRLQQKGQVCFGDHHTCPSSTNLHIKLWSTAIQLEFEHKKGKVPRAIGVRYVNASKHPYLARSFHPTLPFSAPEATKFRADFSEWEVQPSPLGTLNPMADYFNTSDPIKWNIRPEIEGYHEMLLNASTLVEAKREVILAAGVVATPQLLMLSGIGPQVHLEANDIPVLADLPVGNNIQDHEEYTMIFKFRNPDAVNWNVSDLFPDASAWGHVTGPGSVPETHSVMGEFYFEGLDYTDWRNHTGGNGVYGPEIPRSLADFATWTGLGYKSWLVSAAHNCAPGTVRLKNRDPLQTPWFDPNRGGCAKTMRELIHATRVIRKIMAALPEEWANDEVFPGAQVTSNVDLEQYIRTAMWGHQASGGASMGPCEGSHSVADSRGRVYKVDGLRVADITTFPAIPLGNPWMTVAMVAEKLSDNIKQDYAGKPKKAARKAASK